MLVRRSWVGIVAWLLGMCAVGRPARADAGSTTLPRSPAFRKVLSELLPEYRAPKRAVMAPSRAGLPQVGVVAALEKPWRKAAGQVIVAVQVVQFEKGYHEVKTCPETAVALVRTTAKGPEIVARSAFLSGLPREPGATADTFRDCRMLTEIDTADFRIADAETAFGVRLRHDEIIKTGATYRESLALYRVAGTSLRPILTLDTESCDCATSGGHGCGKQVRPGGKCEPGDGSEYRKAYLKILPSKTKADSAIVR